jgi:hypothetical protein
MNPQQMLAQIDQEIETNLPGLGFRQILRVQRFSGRLSDVREVDFTPSVVLSEFGYALPTSWGGGKRG